MHALLDSGRAESGIEVWEKWEEWQAGAGQAQAGRLAVPGGPGELATHYDLTISHPSPEQVQFTSFNRWLAQAAARRGLSCALLHDGVVHEAIQRLGDGRLTVGLHLDYFALWHVADDPYARLAQAVQDAGGWPINPPARSRTFTDKAAAHAELLHQGLGVPETVVVRPWAPDRRVTEVERRRLRLEEPGARVYVKPANGFCHRGVVRVEQTDPESLAGTLASARNFDRKDTFLIQREVRCPALSCDDGVERPAYWRVLYCMGELIPFWWGKTETRERPSYRRLTMAETRRHGLWPVLAYAGRLAEISGLEWFSTELCLSEGQEPSRHAVRGPDRERPVVAIDYVNDQCDVDVQSRWPGAPPDAVVCYLADRFAAAAADSQRRCQSLRALSENRRAA